MESVSKLIKELEANPRRFRATGGYQRMLSLLREGRASEAVRKLLGLHPEIAGDVLWTVAQLENVGPFVKEAQRYLASRDKATAAYAIEVVLRGAQDAASLLAALEQLRSCDMAVCEHAVRTLAGEGLTRLSYILETVGGRWAALAEDTSRTPIPRESIERLVSDNSRDRQVVGLVLATLAYEQDESFSGHLQLSGEVWIREYGKWLMDK